MKVGIVEKTELVLRGGHLRSPVVATGLKCVGGKMFIYLSKANVLLTNFLSKEPARKRPLAKTLVFERIAKARDGRYRQLIKEAGEPQAQAGEATSQVAVTDPCDDLGLDADPVENLGVEAGVVVPAGVPNDEKHNKASKKSRLRKKARLSVPPSAEISIEMAGQPDWKVWVLMEVASKAPAIEATEGNLQILFDTVDNDINYGGARRAQYGSGAVAERPRPKGEAGRRVYAVGRWWVTKVKKEPEELAEETAPVPAAKKYRVLKRRRSAEAGDPKAQPKRQCRQQALPLAAAATGPDCLDA